MILINKVISYKLKSQFKQNKKTYAVDTGLRNAVLLELKRRGSEIYYWKNMGGYEVDFVQKTGQQVQVLLQVSWDVRDDKTRKREERSLYRACEELGVANAMILTEDTGETVERDGVKITYYPLWKWLLDI